MNKPLCSITDFEIVKRNNLWYIHERFVPERLQSRIGYATRQETETLRRQIINHINKGGAY